MTPVVASTTSHTTFNSLLPMQLWGANGLAQGAIFPAMMTLLAACLDKRTRGTVLGLWTTSQQLGGVTSTAFVGYVLQHGGWRAACVRRSLAR